MRLGKNLAALGLPHSLNNLWYLLGSQGLENWLLMPAIQCFYNKESAATITYQSSSNFLPFLLPLNPSPSNSYACQQ